MIAAPPVTGRLAPWILAAAFIAAAVFLRAELGRGIADPAPLPYDDVLATPDSVVRDAASAPQPGDSGAGTPSEEDGARVQRLFVRVESPEGLPMPWRQVGARARGEAGKRLGFTDEKGLARIELLPELVVARNEGRLEAFVRDPGRTDAAVTVVSENAETVIRVPNGAVARILIQDAAGRLADDPDLDRTRVVVQVVETGAAEPIAYTVRYGDGLVAGLPYGVPVRFTATSYGLAPIERTAWFHPDSAEPQPVSLPLERPTAEIAGNIGAADGAGRPIRVSAWLVDGTAPVFTAFAVGDEHGAFRTAAPAGVDILIETRPADVAGRASLWFAPRLSPREAIELPAADPAASLISGRVVMPDGSPAAGALVVAVRVGVDGEAGRRPAPCATTDDDGAFRLAPGGADVRWKPQARFVDPMDGATYVADGAETTGVADGPLLLRLDAGGEIVGYLPGLPREFLGGGGGPSVSIVVEDAAGSVVGSGAPAIDRTFSVRAPAIVARVRVLVPGLAPLVIDDVAVPGGGMIADPRLNPLELPRLFESAVIRAERSDTAPDVDLRLAGAVVAARFDDRKDREPLAATTETLGVARLNFESGTVPTFLVAYAWTDPLRGECALRPAAAKGPGTHTVKLRPGAVVTFPSADALPDPGSDATAQLVLIREPSPDFVADAAPRSLRRPWRRSAGVPQFDSVPDGVWRAKLELVREGARRGVGVLDLGNLEVRPETATAAVALDAAAVSKFFRGE